MKVSKAHKSRFRRLANVVCGTLGAFAFYAATVGLVPAVARHAQDGRFQWLQSTPGILTVLQAYEWPASCLAGVPVARTLFEASADFWCAATDAPETT